MPPAIMCGQWFHGSLIKTNTNRNGNIITCQPPYCLLENGSMVHIQTNTNRNGNDHIMCQPPLLFYWRMVPLFIFKNADSNEAIVLATSPWFRKLNQTSMNSNAAKGEEIKQKSKRQIDLQPEASQQRA